MNHSEFEPSEPASPSALGVEMGATPRRKLPTWLVAAVMTAVLATGAVAWLRAQQPAKIEWAQETVLEFLVPNETKRLTLTFTGLD